MTGVVAYVPLPTEQKPETPAFQPRSRQAAAVLWPSVI